MIGFTLGLLATAWWLHRLPEPLTLSSGVGLVVAGIALIAVAGRAFRRAWAGPVLAMVLGATLAWLVVTAGASQWLQHVLGPELAGEEVTVLGTVTSLPEHGDERSRFRITVDAVEAGPETFRARELLVAAYPGRPEVGAGDYGRMTLRLRPAAGPSNPGGFDRAGWYYREGLHGSATLQAFEFVPGARPAAREAAARAQLHRKREALRTRLERAAPDLRHPGLVQALIIGDRQAMTTLEWQAFLRTGTNHLMAISGLHVGLVAGFSALLAGWLWVWLPMVQSLARKAAVMGLVGLAGAALYAALAGFSIPTQRALIMLAAFMVAIWWRRGPVAWRGLMLAAVAVVLWQPASVLAPGFWFSFGAVAVILLLLHGRGAKPGWREAGAVQVMLALAMLPLSLAWFQLGSWVAPVANLLAVPVISLLVLPLLLVGAGMAVLWAPLGRPFLHAGDELLAILVRILMELARIPVLVDERQVPVAASVLGGVAVLLALQPRLRSALPWLLLAGLALVLPLRPGIEYGAVRMHLLDVGNGQSVVVQTRHHTLLYDAGFGREGGYSAGEQVVAPTLRRLGVRSIDRMLLSHEHAAHAGGAPGVQAALPVDEVLRRRPQHPGERACRAGQAWEWDGVRFEVLHPPSGWDDTAAASCVLAVTSHAGVRLLLTGGLSGLGEAVFMRGPSAQRQADVLVLPRGAGMSSLSRGWLEDAPPTLAWASTDTAGRGLDVAVRERLARACVPLQETGIAGALRLDARQTLKVGPGFRASTPRLWRPAPADAPNPPHACRQDGGLPRPQAPEAGPT
ncbi:DNA internalization-related competence protein ComEC/Rec2 [Thioalkalivibrio sp. ALJ16]|uniref:DNA internalization-related competence protein ComEC/Rec2 n=1 Tax=Thioalkalivibrio sp. ALJ16 TaxID=1158762 RepID=UPI0009DA8C61|nr:DNA internalization-related competence protein ComEC/Rec2 [Thioalkalivibrio sp. ALJ16]